MSPNVRRSTSNKGEIMSAEWMADGKCRDYAAATFFPVDGVGVIRAQKICAQCPVQAACLDYAIDNHVDHGVWGGKSERERRRIARARRRGFNVTSA
jgi:WhiB family redox-sensing transcriptional regulator